MDHQIFPKAKLHVAAEQAVLANRPIEERPAEFQFMEEAWVDAYMCVYFNVTSKAAA